MAIDTSPEKSTTVRASPRLVALRAAMRTLELVAPGTAARWALDLWCTVPSTRGRRRDLRPGPGRTSLLHRTAGALAVETWGEGERPVYLAHGWGGWRGQLGAFVDPLVAAGHRVVAFDAPSHGDSEPGALGAGRGTAPEFAAALADVTAEHGRPAAVVAHSFGASTTALAVADGLDVGRLALVAPAPDPIGQVERFADALDLGPRSRERLTVRLTALARRPLSDFAMAAQASRLPDTLLVHDRRDKEVPFAQTETLASEWSAARLEATDGLGHQRILADPGVVTRVVDFVTG